MLFSQSTDEMMTSIRRHRWHLEACILVRPSNDIHSKIMKMIVGFRRSCAVVVRGLRPHQSVDAEVCELLVKKGEMRPGVPLNRSGTAATGDAEARSRICVYVAEYFAGQCRSRIIRRRSGCGNIAQMGIFDIALLINLLEIIIWMMAPRCAVSLDFAGDRASSPAALLHAAPSSG